MSDEKPRSREEIIEILALSDRIDASLKSLGAGCLKAELEAEWLARCVRRIRPAKEKA
jgi:hypothetical protein